MSLQIFITGGTFDKEYNFINGELYFRDTHLPEMLDRGRCTLPVDIKTLMMIDSLYMKDSDREVILHNCRSAQSQQIIITHGTDKIVETAEYLANQGISEKTVVLTGAMVPYAFGSSSDGFFNLGAAIAFAQCKPPGIFVAMNGKCFHHNNVRKNPDTGFFEPVRSH